jgi:glycosyltransferase involved in cell wall biosynthesis
LPLKVAAKVDTADKAYFEREIEPLLAHANVEFVGEINDAQKPAFLGNARALLFPIDWPEPFGLVMIEAMACGTPVVAWNCGSVPEVIDEHITGRIVDNEDDAGGRDPRSDRLRPPCGARHVRAPLHRARHGRSLRATVRPPRAGT